MTPARRKTVAVSGPGSGASAAVLETAERVGALLAAAGLVVLTGGLDGVMAAAARGARSAGGTVIGLLPGADPAAGNEYLSVALATGAGQARNALLVGAADGLIAVGGSWGTLSEVALAMRGAKPVVWVHGWSITDASGAAVAVPATSTADAAVERLVTDLSEVNLR